MIQAAQSQCTVVDDGLLEVFPDNWAAVQVFLQLETQWNVVAAMSGLVYVGLKYREVEPAMKRERVPRRDWPACWDDIRTMERAALPVLNKPSP